MSETAQFMIFRGPAGVEQCSDRVLNDVADLHYFLDRELQELTAAERADCEEARHAHRALAAKYREKAAPSGVFRSTRQVS
jgi:hypothetical protein